ncbi:SapC family protein [Sagittula salina]|uniref:SapC family protein n=1 Tax=Sagittula salina TaxID=2820268 RepID=A0A940MM71_9RHOB|nr:SapC family protein [Sagittula salina]MBP0484420.1 SapC family protein [Sagittula salina]
MKQMLIYERAQPLRVAEHGDASVKPLADFRFAADLNSVPIVAAEFAAAAQDMAIVFAGTEEEILPAVLLGVEDGANLFIADNGRWTGRYIPAFLRRYPFVFAQNEAGDQLSLCIDEACGALNRDGIGERLFDAEGTRSSYLEQMLEFAAQYQAQFVRTRVFCQRLKALDLLEPAALSVRDGEASKGMAGFFRINRERLKAIPRETLGEMFDTDELELCFLHMQSLTNVEGLSRRRAERRLAEADTSVVQ